jgi:hypothetical protein
MITIIRNPEGSIKTYSEFSDDPAALLPGESLETVNTAFSEYSRRFTLACAGRSGETLRFPRASGDLTVEVRCPGESTAALDINGQVETLPLINGQAALLLGTEVPGTFVLKPADTARYCPAGQAILVIEVV